MLLKFLLTVLTSGLLFLSGIAYGADESRVNQEDRYFIIEVASNFRLPACILAGVLLQEGGTVGKDQVHRYSIDMGLAQIRKGGAWQKHFLINYGITEEELRSNRYIAILAAGYILWKERESTKSLAEAIGAYHRGYANRMDSKGYKYTRSVVMSRAGLAESQGLC